MASSSRSRNVRQDMPFRIEIDRGRGIVAPFGELDIANVDRLDAALRQALAYGADHLVLDLRGLRFIDSQGLHLAIRWNALADKWGVGFTIVQGSPAIQRLFELVGVLDLLPFVDSVEEAAVGSTAAPEGGLLQGADAPPDDSAAFALKVAPQEDARPSA